MDMQHCTAFDLDDQTRHDPKIAFRCQVREFVLHPLWAEME
jgi:hypothetical protein